MALVCWRILDAGGWWDEGDLSQGGGMSEVQEWKYYASPALRAYPDCIWYSSWWCLAMLCRVSAADGIFSFRFARICMCVFCFVLFMFLSFETASRFRAFCFFALIDACYRRPSPRLYKPPDMMASQTLFSFPAQHRQQLPHSLSASSSTFVFFLSFLRFFSSPLFGCHSLFSNPLQRKTLKQN